MVCPSCKRQWGHSERFVQGSFGASCFLFLCSESESGFLTRCSIGLLLIKSSGWRPVN